MGLFDFLRPSKDTPQPQAVSRKVLPGAVGKRMLDAAKSGRTEQSWTIWPTTPDAIIFQEWIKLVARSREQCQNNDHARKFLQMLRDNVAGPKGFSLHAQIKDPSGKADLLASRAIEEAFAVFSERGNFEVTGQMSRADVERQLVSTWGQDGEFLAVFRYGAEAGPYGFAVQLIDPMLLHPMQFEKLANGNQVRHGIEFNQYGRPVAYWVRQQDEMQIGYTVGLGHQKYEVIPAENVIHGFVSELVGQKRGMPQTRTALWRLKMLQGFEDAAVTNARVSAAKMGFFRDPEADTNGEDDTPMDAEPGTFENIGNKEFVAFDPHFPVGDFDPFVKSMLRSVGSGLGVPYNDLANDLTAVNYSSIRQGTLDVRENYKGIQEWLIGCWCDVLYRKWLEWALLKGKITVNGRPLKPERMEKYKAVEFQGRRWDWIDPKSDVDAAEKALALKLKSRSSVIRAMGSDPDTTWQEISREEDEMSTLGVVPEPTPGSPMTQTPQQQAASSDQQPPAA